MKFPKPEYMALPLWLLFLPSAIHAQEGGWYIGVGAGQTHADFNRPVVEYLDYEPFDFGRPFPISVSSRFDSQSRDDKAGTYEFLVGYRLNRYLAVEATYQEIDTIAAAVHTTEEVSSVVFPTPSIRTREVHETRESQGAMLSLIGALPLSEAVSLLGMAGVLYSDTDLERQSLTFGSNGSGPSSSSSHNLTDNSFFVGAGLEFAMGSRLLLRLSYRHLPEVNEFRYTQVVWSNGESSNGDFDLQQAMANVLYRF